MEERKTKKSEVVIIPCSTYEPEQVYQALCKGIEALGGIERFVSKEEKILLKPNFLSAALPEKAVTTHPAVIEGMMRLLSEKGYQKVQYGDSPGHGNCEAAAKKIDLTQAAEKYGIQRANMEEEILVKFPQGTTAREFYFAKGVTEADAVINLCKMKTHALERVTGGVKNVYGLICGYRKAAGHVKYPNASIFARMLVDIHKCVKPRLHIMDGIVAMEGNGPGSGNPTPMNVLLFSKDPVALDTIFCQMVYLDPYMVPTNAQGEAMGLGNCNMKNIRILATDQAGQIQELTLKELQNRFGNKKFDVDRTGEKKNFLKLFSTAMTSISKRPAIRKELCVKCGICVSHCPVPGKALDFKKGRDQAPVYDYKKCIRCYCCQEMCPKHAIVVKGKA